MIVLSPSDVKLIQGLLDESRRRLGIRSRTVEIDYVSHDTYLAYVDSDIPASTGGAGTGSGLDSSPGVGTCSVFKLMDDGTLGHVILDIDVYNPSRTAIAADRWLLVTRDKFGTWWVTSTVDGDSIADQISTLQDLITEAAAQCVSKYTWVSIISNYSASVGDAVTIDATSNAVTVKLPAAAVQNDRVMLCPNRQATTHDITLAATLDDATSYTLNGLAATAAVWTAAQLTSQTQAGGYEFICNGSKSWYCLRPLFGAT